MGGFASSQFRIDANITRSAGYERKKAPVISHRSLFFSDLSRARHFRDITDKARFEN